MLTVEASVRIAQLGFVIVDEGVTWKMLEASHKRICNSGLVFITIMNYSSIKYK